MKTSGKNRISTQMMVLLALFAAITAILAYLGGFIKLGANSVNLTLIPVVIGAAVCGPWAGAFLGGVSGVVILLSNQADLFLYLNAPLTIPLTIFLVMLKGCASGLAAGAVYKLLEKKNRYLSVLVSAVVCPLVNTAIFVIGCFTFYIDALGDMASAGEISLISLVFVSFVGLNFVLELVANVALAPAITRIIDIAKKKNVLKKR